MLWKSFALDDCVENSYNIREWSTNKSCQKADIYTVDIIDI